MSLSEFLLRLERRHADQTKEITVLSSAKLKIGLDVDLRRSFNAKEIELVIVQNSTMHFAIINVNNNMNRTYRQKAFYPEVKLGR